jgi:hypothetical protein
MLPKNWTEEEERTGGFSSPVSYVGKTSMQRKQHSTEFKVKVAIEAIKGQKRDWFR